MKQGFLLPVYRHAKTACPFAQRLTAYGLPIILVDDGNDDEEKALLAECAAKTPQTVLVVNKKNLGKGAAVIAGLEKAAELGITHLMQIDADDQHDESNIPFFLEESKQHPENVICAYPVFDETVPKSRLHGRKVSNTWAAIVTLSTELRDVLCGVRIYPVERTLGVTRSCSIEKRMGFDPDLLVRLYWAKVFPRFYPIKRFYPEDVISNFHPLKSNLEISWVFTRLFISMLPRIPMLLALRISREKKDGKP